VVIVILSNINEKTKLVKLDPKVGIGLAELVRGENISLHVAIVRDRIRPHYHRNRDEIYYIVKGRGIMKVNNEVRAIREGDVILIPKKSVHSLENKGEEPLILVFASAPPFAPEEDRYFIE